MNFEKYLWLQRKETSLKTEEGILRLASNEAWGIRRNVDVTPVTLEDINSNDPHYRLNRDINIFTVHTSSDNFS